MRFWIFDFRLSPLLLTLALLLYACAADGLSDKSRGADDVKIKVDGVRFVFAAPESFREKVKIGNAEREFYAPDQPFFATVEDWRQHLAPTGLFRLIPPIPLEAVWQEGDPPLPQGEGKGEGKREVGIIDRGRGKDK